MILLTSRVGLVTIHAWVCDITRTLDAEDLCKEVMS